MTTLDQFLLGSGEPKSPSQSDELFEAFKATVGEKVTASIEWTNDSDFSCGIDNETFQEVSYEKAIELVGGDEDEFAERFDFSNAWNGIWGSFGEGRNNSIKLGLDNDGGPCIDIRGIFSADTALTVRFLGQPMDGDKFDQLLSDLSNKLISGPQPGEAGSIYAVGDFG
ncbi:MAG: hypothetical protein QNL77_13185 [Akkermansiaceae bacterium]|nr:hypothetical protein [Akkermansiaceae bacterium]